jgi:G3E family GTPase
MSLVRPLRSKMFLIAAATLLRTSASWQASTVRRSIPTLFSTAADASTKETTSITKKPVPITLLSGFLGTGKTTALKYLLENTVGTKIGVIVNDVASVNIDAKLITGLSVDGMVELQNGCACCSLADELFFSVDKIISNRDLDAIVVELSGLADPMVIKNNWLSAPATVTDKAQIARVVTVLDAASFGTDFMTWDQASERKGWLSPDEELNSSAGQRKVSELLAEQVEAADVILMNKIDIADNEEMIQVAEAVARALNVKADLHRVEYGRISPKLVLGLLGDVSQQIATDVDSSHGHSHDHAASCSEPECNDPSHSHNHAHEHSLENASACNEPNCNDPSHSHGASSTLFTKLRDHSIPFAS